MESITYLVTNVFRTYLVYKLFRVFFQQCKFKKNIEVGVYAAYYVLNSIVYLVICVPVCTLLTNIVCMVVIAFLYEGTIRKKLFLTVLQYVLMVGVEVLVSLIFVTCLPNIMERNELSTIIGYITTNLSIYPIVQIVKKIKHTEQSKEIPVIYWTPIIVLPILSIILVISIYEYQSKYRFVTSIEMLVIFIINAIVLWLYDSLSDLMSLRISEVRLVEQNAYYQKQLELYRTSVDNTRIMRHDWKNHLGVIANIAVKSNDIEVQKYAEQLLKGISNEKLFSNTGCIELDAVINYKGEETVQNGIEFKADIHTSKDINIEAVDIVAVIGNLMDNAIRANRNITSNDLKKSINLMIEEKQGNILISITNPYEGTLSKENGNYKTTKKDKENHGVGISEIKQIVNKYNGVILIDDADNIFKVKVVLFVHKL